MSGRRFVSRVDYTKQHTRPGVEKSSAGIPFVYCRVGLNQIHGFPFYADVSVHRTYYALRNSSAEITERITDRQNRRTNVKFARIKSNETSHLRRSIIVLNDKNPYVRNGIGTNEFDMRKCGTVQRFNLKSFAALYYVVTCNYQRVTRSFVNPDNHAATARLFGRRYRNVNFHYCRTYRLYHGNRIRGFGFLITVFHVNIYVFGRRYDITVSVNRDRHIAADRK